MSVQKIPSEKTLSRKRAFENIESLGSDSKNICLRCFKLGHTCVTMSGAPKCSVCTRAGKKCVPTSWSNLEKTEEEAKSLIVKDLDDLIAKQREVAVIMARMVRHKANLALVQQRIQGKTICLSVALNEQEEEERKRNGGDTDEELLERARNGGLTNDELLDPSLGPPNLEVGEASTPLDWSAWGVLGETGEPGLVPLGGS